MFKLIAKDNAFTLKNIFSKIDKGCVVKIRISNKLLVLFAFFFLLTMFFKIYVSNLVIIEAKNVDSLKYRLKITESELKKVKKELSKYSEKDVLLDYSRNFQKEEKIELVVVRE